jgi:hypothetical protein
MTMNILSLFSGLFGEKISRDFAMASQVARGNYFHNHSRYNQRKHRQADRNTIFANRRIARGF